MKPPLSSAEPERLRALASFCLLDTPPEPEFDRLTALAAKLFQVPIALVSLVDAERQWFKSHHGVETRETSRDLSFCAYTILGNRPLIVPDATTDERFRHNPQVTGAPHIRFYAGAPLTTPEGANLGSLCVVDMTPRSFSDAEADTLAQLAAVVMETIQARVTEQRLRQEIAVHEQTAHALRVVEAKYRRIVEHIPGMVYQFVRHADGRVEFPFVSEGSREILGLEPAALREDADAYFRLVHPDDRAGLDQRVARALDTLQPLRWEGRHVIASGQTRWLQITSRPEVMPGGEIVSDGVLLDVTERKQAEERLLMLESSADHANDAILITDAETMDEPGPRIIYVNEAFSRITGYRAEEALGRSPRFLQGPKTSREAKGTMRRAFRNAEEVKVELVNYRKDGSEFWVEMNIRPVADRQGKLTHWVSVQRDITERKETERELRRAKEEAEAARAEAERANTAKSEFLSRMSHELRTPLNAILGFGQLMEMDSPTPNQRESISHVLRGGRYLLKLIDEVLDIARIEAGKMDLTFEPVPVARLLEEVAALVRPLAAQRGVTLELAPAKQALDGATARVDEQRIKQVLLNLLSNAIKYNRPAGKVTVCCEEGGVAGRLRLLVRDTGAGIPAQDISKLFSPFERIGASKGDEEGTGIGLVISRKLTEAMGGTIGVQSVVDHGSTFSLDLPMADRGS